VTTKLTTTTGASPQKGEVSSRRRTRFARVPKQKQRKIIRLGSCCRCQCAGTKDGCAACLDCPNYDISSSHCTMFGEDEAKARMVDGNHVTPARDRARTRVTAKLLANGYRVVKWIGSKSLEQKVEVEEL